LIEELEIFALLTSVVNPRAIVTALVTAPK